MNKKVVGLSLLGIGFFVLSIVVDWLFIIPAAIIVYLNQRELLSKKKTHK